MISIEVQTIITLQIGGQSLTINATEARQLLSDLATILKTMPKTTVNGALAPAQPGRPKWSAHDLTTLDAEYGKTPTQQLALKLGKTPTQLYTKANERGLTKTRQGAPASTNGATP